MTHTKAESGKRDSLSKIQPEGRHSCLPAGTSHTPLVFLVAQQKSCFPESRECCSTDLRFSSVDLLNGFSPVEAGIARFAPCPILPPRVVFMDGNCNRSSRQLRRPNWPPLVRGQRLRKTRDRSRRGIVDSLPNKPEAQAKSARSPTSLKRKRRAFPRSRTRKRPVAISGNLLQFLLPLRLRFRLVLAIQACIQSMLALTCPPLPAASARPVLPTHTRLPRADRRSY